MKVKKSLKDIYMEMTKIAEARDMYKELFFESAIKDDEEVSKAFGKKYRSLEYMFNYLSKIEVECEEF